MTIILTFRYLPVYQALLWCLAGAVSSVPRGHPPVMAVTVVLPVQEGMVAEAVT